MKKFFFLLVLSVISLSAMAQSEVSQSQQATTDAPVFRKGDTYRIGDVTMNKKAYMGFLQSHDAVYYQSFRTAYRLSNVGWGLFGGGLALAVAGGAIIVATPSAQTDANNLTRGLGVCLFGLGDATVTAGITCITIGYVNMHAANDNYNALHGYRTQNQKVILHACLQSSSDGVGLALKF